MFLRTVAAIAEQFNDEKGLVWPKSVAPFHVHLIPVNMKDEAQVTCGEELYNSLKQQGFEVLWMIVQNVQVLNLQMLI